MTTINLNQPHALGLQKARAVAWAWAEEAEAKLAMSCDYEEGDGLDCVRFKRSGVTGSLMVRSDAFDIHVELGFMLSPFKTRIEAEILQNLHTKLNA